MLFEKYSNPEQMSTSENDIGDNIFKNNLETAHTDGEKIISNNFNDKLELSNKTSSSKSILKLKLSEIFPHRKHEHGSRDEMRLLKETSLPIKKQLSYLVTDLEQLNFELEKNCGIKNGFANFLECQTDFTKEILDAYLTSVDLSRNNLNQYFVHQNVEQKRAYHNLGKSINMPKNIKRNENNDLPEDYDDEIEMSVTELEWSISPENIPLPMESEEDDPKRNLNQTRKDQVILETVADIHATLVGDQKKSAESENVSLASSHFKDAGEYKVQRPVPDPQPIDKSFDTIEDVVEQKRKRTMRSKFRSFFARTQNRNRVTLATN